MASPHIRRNYSYLEDISHEQESVLIGTLLGDGNLHLRPNGQNPNLQLGHAPQQKDWLAWKISQFGALFKSSEPKPYFKNGTLKSYYAYSRCHPVLMDYYKQFYVRPLENCTKSIHRKMVTKRILSRVDDQALAVWFCDDGGLYKNPGRHALYLCAGGLGESEYDLIHCWLDSLGLNPTRSDVKASNAVRYCIGVDESELLAKRINPYVPNCMQWKLGEVARG